MEPETFGFGYAIDLLKAGKQVARKGWNGKGMFLFLVKGGDIAKSLHYGFGQYENEPDWRNFIAMKTAQCDLVAWVASQSDILANDWELVK
ncbi:TPA: DUF2829 domain-containing protein [Pasteurella multocida]|nr:DUF2829 domain-containing protein [Pasteurella multocida]